MPSLAPLAPCPFFLYGALAYCDGAGDRLREAFEPLAGAPIVLVKPVCAGVTAREAYEVFDQDPPSAAPLEPLLEALGARCRRGSGAHSE